MARPYEILDVFTATPLEGNPLAVVYEADDLGTEAMQAIAKEFNLSETVFICQSTDPAMTAAMRIFTPVAELPFAGHPTVGAAVSLARRSGTADAAKVSLSLPAGPVVCTLTARSGTLNAAFDAPSIPTADPAPLDGEAIAQALGLSPSDLGFDAYAPARASSGPNFTVVPLRAPGVLAEVSIDRNRWLDAFGRPHDSAYLIAPDGEGAMRARMFAPYGGIGEDPATGSAAVAFAALFARANGDGDHTLTIRQGVEMGRPSMLTLKVSAKAHRPTRVRLSGDAVLVASGTLEM